MTIDELITKLEQADGPSRELDRQILRFISGRVVRDETFIYGPKHGTREIETAYPFLISCWFAPRYTASIDAALTLVDDGMHWEVAADGTAFIRDGDADIAGCWESATPAISVCIAALRARKAKG